MTNQAMKIHNSLLELFTSTIINKSMDQRRQRKICKQTPSILLLLAIELPKVPTTTPIAKLNLLSTPQPQPKHNITQAPTAFPVTTNIHNSQNSLTGKRWKHDKKTIFGTYKMGNMS
jgi:hypothetical protein